MRPQRKTLRHSFFECTRLTRMIQRSMKCVTGCFRKTPKTAQSSPHPRIVLFNKSNELITRARFGIWRTFPSKVDGSRIPQVVNCDHGWKLMTPCHRISWTSCTVNCKNCATTRCTCRSKRLTCKGACSCSDDICQNPFTTVDDDESK